MDADQLAYLIRRALTVEAEVARVEATHTIYSDRLALGVEDHDGALWRVHVLMDPRR
ncbi:hypothetical protein BH23ACT10_BH23ACT10_39080 [soil metagenome]